MTGYLDRVISYYPNWIVWDAHGQRVDTFAPYRWLIHIMWALPAPLRYAKWLVNMLAFPYKKYDTLLVEGPHVWPPFGARYLGHQPCYALIDNETPYFLWAGYLKGPSRWGLLKSIAQYTGLFIVGKMQLRLLQALLGEKMPPSWVLFNGVRDQNLAEAIQPPALSKSVVLFLAHGPGGWCTYYKGLDVWIEALDRAAQHIIRSGRVGGRGVGPVGNKSPHGKLSPRACEVFRAYPKRS